MFPVSFFSESLDKTEPEHAFKAENFKFLQKICDIPNPEDLGDANIMVYTTIWIG